MRILVTGGFEVIIHFAGYICGTDYPTADGTAVRDYIHVEDLAEAHVAALNKFKDSAPPASGFYEVYNLGTGRGYSNREIIEAVKRASGRDFRVIESSRREGDWAASYALPTKVERELGWKAKRGLPEIVESALAWHKSHPYGFVQG